MYQLLCLKAKLKKKLATFFNSFLHMKTIWTICLYKTTVLLENYKIYFRIFDMTFKNMFTRDATIQLTVLRMIIFIWKHILFQFFYSLPFCRIYQETLHRNFECYGKKRPSDELDKKLKEVIVIIAIFYNNLRFYRSPNSYKKSL